MKRLELVPYGTLVRLDEFIGGLFLYGDELCFKRDNRGARDPYVCSTGEYFWGDVNHEHERDALMVQPVEAKWVYDVEFKTKDRVPCGTIEITHDDRGATTTLPYGFTVENNKGVLTIIRKDPFV